MRPPTAGTTIRVLGPYDFAPDDDEIRVVAQQIVPETAYGDLPVRRAIEDDVLSRLLVGLPPGARTLEVIDRMRGQWATDEIGWGQPEDADYIPPRHWWVYRVTVEIKRSEVIA